MRAPSLFSCAQAVPRECGRPPLDADLAARHMHQFTGAVLMAECKRFWKGENEMSASSIPSGQMNRSKLTKGDESGRSKA